MSSAISSKRKYLINVYLNASACYLGRIRIGHDKEDASDVRVGDPHLGAVDDEVLSVLLGDRLEREGIRAG